MIKVLLINSFYGNGYFSKYYLYLSRITTYIYVKFDIDRLNRTYFYTLYKQMNTLWGILSCT